MPLVTKAGQARDRHPSVMASCTSANGGGWKTGAVICGIAQPSGRETEDPGCVNLLRQALEAQHGVRIKIEVRPSTRHRPRVHDVTDFKREGVAVRL